MASFKRTGSRQSPGQEQVFFRAAALGLIFLVIGVVWPLIGGGSTTRAAPAERLQAEIPRPVVMVHGFGSSWEAWQNYLGPEGFLAQAGRQGFAVGDGQGAGVMNTGNLLDPSQPTNTIAENAAILGEYIANVKALTGAEQVDLLAHSMGGLISRYYIGRVMEDRDVAQLIMLGSPMAGTDCAVLPASLGLYLPAALEIRPAYVREIFNVQISDRRGIPFHALAGVPVTRPISSPCTDVPTDLAVSRSSVGAIPLPVEEMPLLHTDLNASPEVFESYVLPLLERSTAELNSEPEPEPAALPEEQRLDFTRVFTGHVAAEATSQELVIPIEPGVSVASFALYEPTGSLTVTVRGASGNVIPLDPDANGLVVIDDPQSLVHLGYGFENPRAGEWRVQLNATERTPPEGASYALTAHLSGGVRLNASADPFLPETGEAVQLNVQVVSFGLGVTVESSQALIRAPDGSTETVLLTGEGLERAATWTPSEPGLYGVDITVTGRTAEGLAVERTAFLAVEAQPEPGAAAGGSPRMGFLSNPRNLVLVLGGVAAGLCLVVPGAVWVILRRRKKRGGD